MQCIVQTTKSDVLGSIFRFLKRQETSGVGSALTRHSIRTSRCIGGFCGLGALSNVMSSVKHHNIILIIFIIYYLLFIIYYLLFYLYLTISMTGGDAVSVITSSNIDRASKLFHQNTNQRVIYKLSVLTYKALHWPHRTGQPCYLADLVELYRPSRVLHFAIY